MFNKKLYIFINNKFKKINKIKLLITSIFSFLIIIYGTAKSSKKKIGIVSCENNNNIGNNLVKFAMYTKLKELNFDPTIIALTRHKNIYFIKKYMKYKEIKLSYDELKEKDYDFLVVNSDQTWVNVTPNYLLDYGYLKFAEHWNIRKFIYGASYPLNFWIYRNDFNIKAGNLLKKFSGVSVREINTVSLAEKYLRVKPEFVLDPTLLIDKKYYLNLIKDYKNNYINFNYICIYQLDKNDRLNYFIENSSRILNFTIHKVDINKDNYCAYIKLETLIFYLCRRFYLLY